MRCDIITLFPGIVSPFFQESILRRAVDRGLLRINVHQLRDYAQGKHQVTDDVPYGGGPGMVLKPEPIFSIIDHLRDEGETIRIILTSPQGNLYSQETAKDLAGDSRRMVFICGRYEGVDERVKEGLPLEEISIGDYILSGGELAAMAMIEAAVRLIPGVLGEPQSLCEESFSSSMPLEYPQYTRPAEYRGMRVPSILTSGNHKAISAWRRQQALQNTLKKRPGLLEKYEAKQ